MADSYVLAVFKVEGRPVSYLPRFGGGNPLAELQKFVHDVRALKAKITGGFTVVDDSGDEPGGAIACDNDAITNGDTITFTLFGYDIVFTVGVDFDEGDDDDGTAVNLANAINNHPQLSCFLSAPLADIAAGALSIVGKFPGDLLENVTMATSDAAAFMIAQLGVVQVGADGDASYFAQGRGR